MQHHSRTTIAHQLSAARMLIGNSLATPSIGGLVATRGYTVAVLMEGQQRYEAAVSAVEAQAAAVGAQLLATDRVRVTQRQARDSFQRLAQTVRALFPEHAPQRKALDVTGPMPQESASFLVVAATMFSNAQSVSEIADVLAKYGYDQEMLRSEYLFVEAYQQALLGQLQAKSAVRQATSLQNNALVAQQQWVAQYSKIAKIALRDHPDLLKALGVSGGRYRAPAAPVGA